MDEKSPLGDLEASEESRRLYAIDDVLGSGRTEYAPELAARLSQEQSIPVRNALVFALQELENPSSYESLFSLFDSPEADVRNGAVLVFGSYGPEAVRFLSARFASSGADVRKCILDAVSLTPHPEAVPVIREGLRDPDQNVRIAAVEHAATLGDGENLALIRELAESTGEPMLRTAVLSTLLSAGRAREVLATVRSFQARGEDTSLYTPQVLKALEAAGSELDLMAVMQGIEEPESYADDLLGALPGILTREPGVAGNPAIRHFLTRISAGELSGGPFYDVIEHLLELGSEEASACLREIVEAAPRSDHADYIRSRLQGGHGEKE